jgi:bifunctional non-homologous end joining protein LigD
VQVPRMPLAEPPRDSRFGSPLKLSRVLHEARPEVVVEVTYLS